MLGQIESESNGTRAVIADLEAGLGTLTRMKEGSLDRALLVVNPSIKSIEVAQRARQIIAERKIAPVSVIIANRLRDGQDLRQVRTTLGDADLVAVPEDPEVRNADLLGVSPVDVAADSPAVAALTALARTWRT